MSEELKNEEVVDNQSTATPAEAPAVEATPMAETQEAAPAAEEKKAPKAKKEAKPAANSADFDWDAYEKG